MIVYLLLLFPVAVFAYGIGSMDTLVLASNYIFRFNLLRLGKGNDWLSNFRRVYGLKGAIGLLLAEAIKDSVPIIIGGLLLGLKGHPEAGRAFAGFCLVFGRCFPVFYRFKGSRAVMPLIFTALYSASSLGIVTAAVFVLGAVAIRYATAATVISALACIVVSLLVVEDKLCILLIVFACAAVVIRSIPDLRRMFKGAEEKLAVREDLGYKFDLKF